MGAPLSGLTDAADEAALRSLYEYVQQVQTKLFVDDDHFIDGWYVTDAPEWLRTRELANAGLAMLRRPVADRARC